MADSAPENLIQFVSCQGEPAQNIVSLLHVIPLPHVMSLLCVHDLRFLLSCQLLWLLIQAAPTSEWTQSPESPEEAEPPSAQQETSSQPSELPEDLESSGSQLEAPGLPAKTIHKVKTPFELEASVPALDSSMESVTDTPPVTVKNPRQDQYGLDSIKAKPANVEITKLSKSANEAASSLVQQEPHAQPPNLPMENKPLNQQLEQAQPSDSPGESQPPRGQLEVPDQASEHADVFTPSLIWTPDNRGVTVSSPGHHQDQHLDLASANPPALQLAVTPVFTEEVKTSPIHHEAMAQASAQDSVQPPEGVEPPPIQQELTAQPPGSSVEASTIPLMTDTMPVSLQNLEAILKDQESTWPKTTVKHVDVGFTITPNPTLEAGVPVQQEGLAQSIPTGQVGFSTSQHDFSSQSPNFPETESPVQQETIPPSSELLKEVNSSLAKETPGLHPQPTTEVRSSPAQYMTPSQLAELPENMEPLPVSQPSPTQPSEPFTEVEAAATQQAVPPELLEPTPTHYGMTVPTPGQNPIQPPTSASVTFQHLDPEFINSEPTRKAENSTTMMNTASTLVLPEVTPPDQVQDQHSKPSKVTLPPFDLELSLTAGSNMDIELSPTLHETLTKPQNKLVTQVPVLNESADAKPGKDQTQLPVSPKVTVEPPDLILTVTREPQIETEHSATMRKTAFPLPKNPEVTSPYQVQTQTPQIAKLYPKKKTPVPPPEPPEETVPQSPVPTSGQDQARRPGPPTPEAARSEAPTPSEVPSTEQSQIQSPNPAEVTALPLEVGFLTQYSGSYTNDFTVSVEQTVTTGINICELCLCQNETLSCVGLSPGQKLHQVPIPGPNTYNGTFTTLNFQGNEISYIDKDVWKAYCWTEKLILNDNRLTELRKDTFESLLSLQDLNLSCNKIRYIERGTFESLPFLKYINLGCNLVTEVSFGTFQAWHGMRFLHKIILNRNPLTVVEDPYLFKLPALKYLDLGRTHVKLTTIQNVLMMNIELEKLILPGHLTCCLCQFKSNIEVICKTVKLHCESGCQTNTTHCLEEASIGNPEGAFMKALLSRKETTNTELTIEPDKEYLDKNGASFSDFMNEQLDFDDESDIIRALNYILPYFSEGNVEAVASTLLPFIKLLFSNAENADNNPSSVKRGIKDPLKSVSSNSAYKNKLNKLYFLENLLDAEIQEQIDEIKKKEKTAMLHLGPKLKRQIVEKEMETEQGEANGLEEAENGEKRLPKRYRVHKRPGSTQERHLQKARGKSRRRKPSAQPPEESTASDQRQLRSPVFRYLGQLDAVQKPRNLVENSFPAEPSLTREYEAAVSPSPAQYWIGMDSTATPAKSLPEFINKGKDLNYTISILEDASAKVRGMKNAKSVLQTKKSQQNLGKKKSHLQLMVAKRPRASAVRSLINSLPRGALSSSEDLNSLANPFPEIYTLSDPSPESTPVENETATSTFEGSVTSTAVPEETVSESTPHKNPYGETPVNTFDNILPDKETGVTQLTLTTKPQDLPDRVQLSAGNEFESQLYKQMQPLIPNNNVRKLVTHVLRTLKMDCSKTQVQLSCARLLYRTGLLMKLLSEQQEFTVSEADWDTEQWKTENYINESTEAQSEPRRRLSNELTKEYPDRGYTTKLILTISVTAVVTVVVIIFCLVEVYSHRTGRMDDEERASRGCFPFRRRRLPRDRENQDGFYWLKCPLWLRDMYRPLHATRKKNMAEKLQDKDSSDEDETFVRNTRETTEAFPETTSVSKLEESSEMTE